MIFHRHDTSLKSGGKHINGGFHVDDGKFITNSKELFAEVVEILATNGLAGKTTVKPEKFLGIKYVYKNGSVKLHQKSNVEQFLHSLNLSEAKPCATPMDPNTDIRDEEETTEGIPGDLDKYRSLCGQGIWLLQTRFDAAFTVGALCKRMSKPELEDEKKIKRFGRYLAEDPERGLYFHPRKEGEVMQVYFYVDASLYLKAISGVAGFLGTPDLVNHNNKNAAIVCFSKPESLAVTSTMEAELLAIGRGVVAAEWVADLLEEMGYPQVEPPTVFTDSQPAIRFLERTGPNPNRQTRHLRLKVNYIREAIQRNKIVLRYVPTGLNCADILTKALGKELHRRHSRNIMGMPFEQID